MSDCLQFLATTLSTCYIKARRELNNITSSFAALDAGIRRTYKKATVAKWENMSTKPFRNDKGEWDSVYRSKSLRKYAYDNV